MQAGAWRALALQIVKRYMRLLRRRMPNAVINILQARVSSTFSSREHSHRYERRRNNSEYISICHYISK